MLNVTQIGRVVWAMRLAQNKANTLAYLSQRGKKVIVLNYDIIED